MIEKLAGSASFGAYVDMDLAGLDAERGARLRELLHAHRLLVFHGQALDREGQRRLAACFGPVFDTAEDTPYISNVRDDGVLGAAELAFHSDNEYCPEPVTAITLHALEVEDGKTSTKFVDGTLAYRRLPRALRERLDGLAARHVLGTDLSARNRRVPKDPRWPQAIHPVAKLHPATGETILYVTEMQTRCIEGLDESESEDLIAELFGYLYDPAFQVEHFWRTGDLLVWDNFALQHARAALSAAPRTLQRVSVGRSLAAQHPEYQQAFAAMREGILSSGVAGMA